jgi:hypothetical protein
MSEFKGTKGKWRVENHDQVMCNGKTVADCENNRKMNWECEANAKLISCAPEMLSKLHQCISAMQSCGSINDERGLVYTPQIGIAFVKSIEELIIKATTV